MSQFHRNVSELFFPFLCINVICYVFSVTWKYPDRITEKFQMFLNWGCAISGLLDIFQVLEIIRKANEFQNKMLHWSI